MSIIHLEPTKQITDMVRIAFPRYNGRKYRIDNSGRPVNITSYWSGGSRDYFAVVNLETRKVLPVPQNGTVFDGGPIASDGVVVPPGYVIIEHSIAMGKDFGITIYIDPDTAIKFLPDPVKINDNERIVLEFTRTYKNTYAGIKNYRFYEASKKVGISRDAWNVASDSLKTAKLLNKAGAITTTGRNALEN